MTNPSNTNSLKTGDKVKTPEGIIGTITKPFMPGPFYGHYWVDIGNPKQTEMYHEDELIKVTDDLPTNCHRQ